MPLCDLIKSSNADFVDFHEAKKQDIPVSFLCSIASNKKFIWHSLPSVGFAGGIIVDVNFDFV